MISVADISLGFSPYRMALNHRLGHLYAASVVDGAIVAIDIADLGAPSRLWEVGWQGKRMRVSLPPDPNDLIDYHETLVVSRVSDISVSPDAHQVALLGPDSAIEVRDARTGKLVSSIGSDGRHRSACFHPNGISIIAGGWYEARDIKTRDCPGGLPPLVRAAIYRLDGGEIASQIESDCWGKVSVHPEEGLVAGIANNQGSVRLEFVRIAEGFRGPKTLVEDYTRIDGFAFSVRGDCFAAVGEEEGVISVEVFDFPSCSPRFCRFFRLPDSYQPTFQAPMQCLFQSDGTSVFFPVPTGFVLQLDAETGNEISRWKAHDGPLYQLDLWPERGLLVTAGVDGIVRLWETERRVPATVSADRPLTKEFDRLGNRSIEIDHSDVKEELL